MAAVFRAPFYVPRPSDDSVWQGPQSRGSAALLALTAAKFFGANGQVPTKSWRYDYDVGEAFWEGGPEGSAVLPILTAAKFFGANGQAPTKRWRIDPDAGESFWQGRPLASAALAPLLTVGGQVKSFRWGYGIDEPASWQAPSKRNLAINATPAASPFVNPSWRFGSLEETFWQGSPDGSAILPILTAAKLFGANGQSPTKRWSQSYTLDDTSPWQFVAMFNLGLASNLAFPASRGGSYNSPDEAPAWQRVSSRNLNALSVTVASSPFVNSGWRFGYADDPGWTAQPNDSAAIALLTATKFFGANGQAPTKRWRIDPDVGESFWLGRPLSNAILTPLLTVGGQVKSFRWAFGIDEVADWQAPGRRNLAINVTTVTTPFVNPSWRFGNLEETFWQAKPGSNPIIAPLLTGVKFFGAGGQSPTKRWRIDPDSGESFWLGRPSASATLAPLLTIGGQVKSFRWSFGSDDAVNWRVTVERNLALNTTPTTGATPFVNPSWRFDNLEETFWQGRPAAAFLRVLYLPHPPISTRTLITVGRADVDLSAGNLTIVIRAAG